MKKLLLLLTIPTLVACQTTQPQSFNAPSIKRYEVSYAQKEVKSTKPLAVRSNEGFSKVFGTNSLLVSLMVEAILKTCPNSFVDPDLNHSKRVEFTYMFMGKEKAEKAYVSMIDIFRKSDNANSCGMKY